jgi:hypothetical protein
MKAVADNLTPKQIAIRELEQEMNDKAVGMLKDKLLQVRQAKQVVANLEREIEDLEMKIQDGNI